MNFFQSIDVNATIYIVYAVLIAGVVIVVISENRTPVKTIAWMVVLIFVPVAGLIIYYFFGQDTRRMRHISEKKYKEIKDLSFKSLAYNRNINILPEYANLINLLKNSNFSPVLQGSEIEILTDSAKTFDSLLKDIGNAKHHIHMEFFIFKNDSAGKRVKEILMRKAEEGVEVRFIYDNVANWLVPKWFYNEMKKSGVQITSLMKVHFPKFAKQVNYRNHRKVVVIDGVTAYMGGMNISDNYTVNPNWRDTQLRVKGQGALGLQASFLIDWYSSGEAWLDDEKYFPEAQVYTGNLMQIATGGPYSLYHNLLQATVNIIIGAKKYIYLQTPYFLPSESLFLALQMASLSGVDVRLMVSEKSDSPYVDPAAHSYYADLLEAGIKIYEMVGKFIHAKTIVADDMLSVTGSANLDFRSFETNFEINGYIYDPEIARRNREIFFRDMQECREIKFEDWMKRPGWRRFFDSTVRLFAPMM
ncbi:MAG: cardiolipin synthase [Dysgonamonadaceae bacterium]|jgi:cardiolipin synthase|nr:cardiolipin synthase [Dysgonamonadaceae bacterium]